MARRLTTVNPESLAWTYDKACRDHSALTKWEMERIGRHYRLKSSPVLRPHENAQALSHCEIVSHPHAACSEADKVHVHFSAD